VLCRLLHTSDTLAPLCPRAPVPALPPSAVQPFQYSDPGIVIRTNFRKFYNVITVQNGLGSRSDCSQIHGELSAACMVYKRDFKLSDWECLSEYACFPAVSPALRLCPAVSLQACSPTPKLFPWQTVRPGPVRVSMIS
jgi:hypothetical protein